MFFLSSREVFVIFFTLRTSDLISYYYLDLRSYGQLLSMFNKIPRCSNLKTSGFKDEYNLPQNNDLMYILSSNLVQRNQ